MAPSDSLLPCQRAQIDCKKLVGSAHSYEMVFYALGGSCGDQRRLQADLCMREEGADGEPAHEVLDGQPPQDVPDKEREAWQARYRNLARMLEGAGVARCSLIQMHVL